MRSILILLIVTFLSIGGVNASEGDKKSTTLVGKVSDAANLESLAGAEVSIPELGIKTFCDFDGNFRFGDIPAGEYTVEVQFVSYQSASFKEVEAGADGKQHKFVLNSF